MTTYQEDREYYRDFSNDQLENMLADQDADQRIAITAVLAERQDAA